ncbi:MAG: hypothetical protein GW839_07645 [Flavobacteriales bacterium]|nr:hypothetical protein [Flavobacteriia bacterium]NCP06111.1 hypothetical protein [Flavobacteriales bacterium]PIV94550.1 MAG: hypothetical protein COW44_03605 [Flavobacteriaceae bacterium CG17_big_fil_post_rev_8_21_14_2_50_33_15]PIY10511.1 MAG: hypothetical protein COZ17_09680 [Flavobacteriaceae bacterium CG_4_10_14_3_um_filter_33_47]PJB16368.1 MAG: hypothetical protein CO117_15260 [Flavobacteriaceae bacterium CG_4_9_14_3_um_filter_33_16]
MRIFTIILSVLAFLLIAFNATKINLDSPFKDESAIALITILAALCALVLLQILRISKRIEVQTKKKK